MVEIYHNPQNLSDLGLSRAASPVQIVPLRNSRLSLSLLQSKFICVAQLIPCYKISYEWYLASFFSNSNTMFPVQNLQLCYGMVGCRWCPTWTSICAAWVGLEQVEAKTSSAGFSRGNPWLEPAGHSCQCGILGATPLRTKSFTSYAHLLLDRLPLVTLCFVLELPASKLVIIDFVTVTIMIDSF